MLWRPIAILICAWAVCAGVGLAKMLRYELTPTPSAAAPASWPHSTGIARDPSRPTLVLFLHPHCPCSRATLAELERLIAASGDRFALRIVFVRPAGMGDAWEQTDLHRAAEKILQASVCCDLGGIEATRFGAKSSGQALLYATNGELLFRGGLTPSRGHEGDNVGRDALTALISGGHTKCSQTAVFGCSLIDRPSPSAPRSSDATTD